MGILTLISNSIQPVCKWCHIRSPSSLIFQALKTFAKTYTSGFLTCWAQPEVLISEHHQQQPATQQLREAQRDVSVFSVWIIPTITSCAAEPPQHGRLQPNTRR